MRIYLTALGCKLNRAEIEALARGIEREGHCVVADPVQADWAIVNTCTVTHIAAQKSRQALRHLRRQNAALRIAVVGCYAEMSPEVLEGIEGVVLVIPNAHKDEVLTRILDAQGTRILEHSPHPPVIARPAGSEPPRRLALGHTRAFVKIQDGCDNRCTYCIVRVARGPQRSRPPEEVLDEIAARLAEGYREIVLTGVHIGAYGRDSASQADASWLEGWSLARLVQTILERTAVPRLRLSSIEPWDLRPEMLGLWADRRLCRHIHLPLQSGCDDMLRRMGRRYTAQGFAQLVEAIRRQIPEVSLTTDVIVGFPGESEAEFAQSRAFIEQMAFARLHVFRYSPRAGTLAAEMPDQVPTAEAQARSEALIRLGRDMALAFHQRFVQSQVCVLFEQPRDEGDVRLWSGLTDNYLRVSAPSRDNLSNAFACVRCLAADEMGLRGGDCCVKVHFMSHWRQPRGI